MATTTKTLTPTNQTITLPDMTERPNASVLVDGIGKDADAINALSEQIANLITSSDATISNTSINRVKVTRIGNLVIVHGSAMFTSENATISNLPVNKSGTYMAFNVIESEGTNNPAQPSINPNDTSISLIGMSTTHLMIIYGIYMTA